MELAVDHRTPLRSAPPVRRDASDGIRDGDALSKVLAELGDRVKPVVLAREQTMPVSPVFESLLPDEGLMRGRVMSCHGAAAATAAFGLVAEALIAGAWMAVVDVTTFGADAAAELGIPLERVVRAGTGTGAEERWVEVMAAAVDGFDVVVTRVPEALRGDRRPASVRTLTKRIQRHGAVVISLGESGALSSDVELHTVATVWSGLGAGDGHLRRRRIDIESSGRRLPGGRRGTIELVGEGSRVRLAAVDPAAGADERDPQAELLAEMAGVEVHDIAVHDRADLDAADLDGGDLDGGSVHRLVG